MPSRKTWTPHYQGNWCTPQHWRLWGASGKECWEPLRAAATNAPKDTHRGNEGPRQMWRLKVKRICWLFHVMWNRNNIHGVPEFIRRLREASRILTNYSPKVKQLLRKRFLSYNKNATILIYALRMWQRNAIRLTLRKSALNPVKGFKDVWIHGILFYSKHGGIFSLHSLTMP